MKSLRTTIIAALVLFLSAQVLGALYYLIVQPPLFVASDTGNENDPIVISIDTAYSMFESKSGLFIDTRTEEEYNSGHIPGALLWNTVKNKFYTIHEIDSAESLIFYCSQGCESAMNQAKFVSERINKPIYVIFDGFEVWSAYGYPQEIVDK
ncbi:MAG: hypothetical protein Kow00108_19780 [Calditrichia bacterium]